MRRSTKTVLKLAVGVTLLGVVLSWRPWGEYAAVWRGITPWPAILAFCLTAPMVMLRARQAQYLASLQGMRLGFGPLVGLQLATTFYGLFAPGIVAMGLLRWYRLARLGGDPKATLALVVFSRMVEIEMALLTGLLFWAADQDAPRSPALPLAFAGMLVAVAAIRWLSFHPQAGSRATHLMQAVLPTHLGVRLRSRLVDLLEVGGRYGALTARAWLVLLLNVLVGQVLSIATIGLLATALGMDVGWATLGWARAVLTLALLLPITWAGVGLREATLAAALVAAGQPAAAAVSLGLLLGLRVLLEAAAGGIVEWHPWQREPEYRRSTPT